MSNGHAVLAPSGAHKWIHCAASPRMELRTPDLGSSFYADQGTAAHFLASTLLDRGLYMVPPSHVGMTVHVSDGKAEWRPIVGATVLNAFEIDETMAEHVNVYLATLEEYKGEDGTLMAEHRLDISPITGEEDAKGTCDALILRGTELQSHDLKYGMNMVDIQDNPQLLIYAAAALEELSMVFQIETILIKIHQPRLMAAPEQSYTIAEFEAALAPIKEAAARAQEALRVEGLTEEHFTPGEHCTNFYCNARANCPALADWCTEGENEDPMAIPIVRLAELAQRVPTIKKWAEAVQERVSGLVLSGAQVPGFKAVMSREGNRTWDSEESVAATLAGMKLPRAVAYEEKLRSAPQMEKQFEAGLIGPRQWPKLVEHITRSPAKPVVVPESDKRPEIETCDDFVDIS
jgi:hypothetical protein